MNQKYQAVREAIKKCHWCQRFIGNTGQQSGGHDKNWYCKDCYRKGLEMEYEAMGRNDPHYANL